jgi:hypothetical protein
VYMLFYSILNAAVVTTTTVNIRKDVTTGDVDTGGKYATSLNSTSGAPLAANIFANNFRQKIEIELLG